MQRHSGSSHLRGDVSPINTDVQSTLSQVSPVTDIAPEPPQHRGMGSSQGNADNRPQIDRSASLRTNVTATPGADNLSMAAVGGGISGIAFDVANRNERQSGVEAVRSIGAGVGAGRAPGYFDGPSERGYTDMPNETGNPNPYPYRQTNPSEGHLPGAMPLGGTPFAAHTPPQQGTPSLVPSNPSQLSVGEPYPRYPSGGLYDGPYRQSYHGHDPALFNPNDIADDGEDDLMNVPPQAQQRRSWFRKSNQALGAAAIGGAAAGGVMGAMNHNVSSDYYSPVPTGSAGGTEGAQASMEKNALLAQQTAAASAAAAAASRRKRLRITLLVIFGIMAVIVGAIVGGILGSQAHNNASSSNGGSGSSGDSSSDPGTNINTAAGDLATNGDLDKNSPEIQKLMNNPNLHRVFHGMDYTSWGVQYPLCLTYPPSPNNVTRDMAILSQLTDTVRVYGTDCNQTQMVLHSISQLGLTDMKLWMGVWISSNQTTSDRQVQTLYDIIDSMNDTSIIQGVIVGNEVLYSGGFSDQATAQATLITYLQDVRSNLTAKGLKVPVATSDLGDNWTADLLAASDLVMANVHPFFGGVPVPQAANWTIEFFDEHDVSLTTGTGKGAIISEVGWPGGGGNDCGAATCTDTTSGSVAGISELNQFLSEWVCQALANGTQYFWFEAFDEPWKVIYNTPGKDWEDQWGLLDSGRNLKQGVNIPDCGGKTVTS